MLELLEVKTKGCEILELTVAEKIMFSTLPIFEMDSECKKAVSSSTCFALAFRISKTEFRPMLVTNQHVFHNTTKIAVIFTLQKKDGSPDIGNTIPVYINSSSRIEHDNLDLAVIPLEPFIEELEKTGKKPFIPCFTTDLIPTEAEWKSFDAMEPVITMGYPDGHRDQRNNLPISRSGTTATHPAYDFDSRPEFWVDLPCYKGCSGSPVYIKDNQRLFLLGVIYKIQITSETASFFDKESAIYVPLNIAQVIKATRLLDFIPKILPMS